MVAIKNFEDIRREAQKAPLLRLAVLAPEDKEFMCAVKQAYEENYIIPTLIGCREAMERAAEEADFNIELLPKIFEKDLQNVAYKGLEMLFSGEVSIVSKGQMPTALVYRAVIKHDAGQNNRKISVISLIEMPSWPKFIIMTDAGVNINPDWKTKLEILRGALSFAQLLGYVSPRALFLTASREINRDVLSRRDAVKIKEVLQAEGCDCILEEGNFKDFLSGDRLNLPDIIIVHCLDVGNIVGKLDFFLNARRRAFVMSTKGPVLIPSRADTASQILNEIILGVVVATRLGEDINEKIY